MVDLDNLQARLEAVRVALPDPDDIASPNARHRQGERNALVQRTNSALHQKRRRLATLQQRIGRHRAELERWFEVEAALQARLDEARDALPGITDYRDRERAERSIAALEDDLRQVEEGVNLDAGLSVASGTFSQAFEAAFGEPGTQLRQHLPAGELRAVIEALETEAGEVRDALDQVAGQVEALLAELEREAVAA